MIYSTKLSDYMQENPATVKPDMPVYEAAVCILEHKVSGLLVIDDSNQLVGMLSEMDCLGFIFTSMYNNEDFGTALVSDIMTRDVSTQSPQDNIVDVATSMLDHKHRRRPVVVDGKVVGQVTCRQILKVVTEGLKEQKPGDRD